MKKSRVLFISQEITPYLDETELSKNSRVLPQGIQESGKEIRTFMPKFGCINERRNQLHEVIRLSGMNLIINDLDHAADVGDGAGEEAFLEHFHVHDGLVGFDRGHDVAALDRVARFLLPGDHDAFGHGVGQLRHDDRRARVVRDHLGLRFFCHHLAGGDGDVARGVGDVASAPPTATVAPTSASGPAR